MQNHHYMKDGLRLVINILNCNYTLLCIDSVFNVLCLALTKSRPSHDIVVLPFLRFFLVRRYSIEGKSCLLSSSSS